MELLRLSLADTRGFSLSLSNTLFAETDYKVGGLALVFRRTRSPDVQCDPAHQDKATGWPVYQMEDPAPNLPGGLRLLIKFTKGRTMEYSRRVGCDLVPLSPAFGTAQVIGQSTRAAGAPRSSGGECGDLFHTRINSRSGGGAAGAEPEPAQQQQSHMEVTVRLDVRLPALGGGRSALQVPKLSISAYSLFHISQP